MNVVEYLVAGKASERIALNFPQYQCSYGTLIAQANHVAAYLRRLGAKKGDRVFLIADNSQFWVASYLGTMQAGLVCVPVAANSQPGDLEYIMKTTEAQIVFARSSVTRVTRSRFAGGIWSLIKSYSLSEESHRSRAF